MLQLELRRNAIYLTTDRRADMMTAIAFLQRELQKMEDLGSMQRTIYETHPPKEIKIP